MKQIKHFLLTVAMLLCSTFIFAHDFEVDGIYYGITSSADKTVAVTYRGYSFESYSNEYSGSVTIPESVTYNGTTYSVTSIGDYAFYYCSGLTSVEIPNSVTSIGDYAFYYCDGLTSVEIPNSVTSIGDYAFVDCSGLTSVEIPNSVTSIGYYAFHSCSGLTSVTIPNGVTSIGGSAFENTPWYYAKPNGLVYINNVLYEYKGIMPSRTTIGIKEGTISISSSAFRECSGLTSVTIPNSVTSIGDRAFESCFGLTSVIIPNSVTSIGVSAFKNCSNLTSVIIPNSVTSIESSAFSSCDNLTSIEIPNSVTSIGDGAFSACFALTSVTIPNSVTSIGRSAFNQTEWYNNKSDGLVYINNVLYKYKGTMPSGTTVEIKEGTISISPFAFYDCSGLTSVTIPNSVTSIGYSAFNSCSNLTSIEIPNSVTSIERFAFTGCDNLTSIIVDDENTTYDSRDNCNAIIETETNELIVGFKSTIIPNSVTSIGEDAFSACSWLTSIEIPNSVTSIGSWAFYGCSGLTSIEIPNSVTSIGDYAFYYCDGLTSVEIPNSVTSIGYCAFSGCSGLTSVTIPNSVTSIWDRAFSGCSGLTSVTIGNSVTSIENYAFYNCSGLKSITSYIPAEKLFTPQTSGFEGVDKTGCILYVPKGAKEKYATTDGWKDFINIVEILETYKVTFVVDGEVFATDSVTEGNSLVFPNVPEKEGYTFLGWSEAPETMPANDITITGEWSINSYLVTFIIDGEVYATDSVEYGAAITLPEVPEKENCTFEWEEAPETMPASDLTIYGNYVSGIGGVTVSGKADVYTLNGMLYKRDVDLNNLSIELPKGVYIINGKKIMVK